MYKCTYHTLLCRILFCLVFYILPAQLCAQKELVIIDSVHNYDLNPHTANYSSEAQILNGLYEGLFSYDPITLDAVPALAQSFRISRDKKMWTFTLQKDVFFSNGEPIEAKDVKRSWLTLLNPALNAPFASLFDCIQGAGEYRRGKASEKDVGITVKNAHTLELRLHTATEHLPKILCHHAFAVVHPQKNVFSGAFILKERTADTLVLQKNELYREHDSVALPSIRIIQSADTKENTFRFNNGTAHWVTGAIDAAKTYERTNIIISPQFGTEFLFFKASNGLWTDKRMRKAVLLAVPWQKLRADTVIAADTFVLPLNGYPAVYGINEYDPEAAKEMIDEVKTSLGKNAPKEIELSLAIPNLIYAKDQAALISEALKKVGIKVSIQTSPSERYLNGIKDWNADMFTYTWIGDFADPLAFLELFRSASSLRETEWHDKAFDTLLAEAASQENEQLRYAKLAEAEQLLLDESIVLPISHPVSVNAVDLSVLKGWFSNALDIHPFKYLFFNENPLTDSDDFI